MQLAWQALFALLQLICMPCEPRERCHVLAPPRARHRGIAPAPRTAHTVGVAVGAGLKTPQKCTPFWEKLLFDDLIVSITIKARVGMKQISR